jgi:hypothetical protein
MTSPTLIAVVGVGMLRTRVPTGAVSPMDGVLTMNQRPPVRKKAGALTTRTATAAVRTVTAQRVRRVRSHSGARETDTAFEGVVTATVICMISLWLRWAHE